MSKYALRLPFGHRLLLTPLLFVALATQLSSAEQSLSERAREQYARFRDGITGTRSTPPELCRAPSWVEARTPRWVFVCDIAGNRTFRPAQVLRYLASTWLDPVSTEHEKLTLDSETRDRIVSRTRRIASSVAEVAPDADARVHVKREIILVRGPKQGGIERFAGRYLVRLAKLPGGKFLQVVYSPDQQPIRIDTNVRDSACAGLADALANLAGDSTIPVFEEHSRSFAMGTFFDPGEYRFELRAYSFEGEPFLNLSQHSSPFGRDHFDLSHKRLVDTQVYRQSKDYHYWCWRWWSSYGRVGGVRGNWLPEREDWEYPQVEIQFHKSFADYELVGGEPKETREYKDVDGSVYTCPFAGDAQFERAFYEDLERCHVAMMTTHGGHSWRHRFRFRRNPDVWVEFKPNRELGSRNLRHLLIEGCGSMTYVEDPRRRVLLETWMSEGVAGGINTICGADGNHTGIDRSGWRFFGRYNKGDSISDAWTMRDMDENPENNPVTVAYGRTRRAVLDTLFNGRFTCTPTRSTWVAVSVWTNPPDTPTTESPR